MFPFRPMRTPLSACFAAALLLPAAVSAATFEGTVKMKMTGQRGSPTEMTFSLADGRSRIDMQTPDGASPAMLFDAQKQEMTILMPEQRMYMVRPLPKPGETPPGAPSEETASIEKTGETEEILGYDTEKYISRSREGITEIWVTDELGTFMGLGAGGPPMGGRGRRGSSMPEGWANALRGKEAFPLRVVTKDAKGKELFRMEATAVDQRSLPDSTFIPPADYQKFDMGGMMRGMGLPGMRPPGN